VDAAEQIQKGNRLALARWLTQIENDLPQGQVLLDRLFSHSGHSAIIGITGPSGSGKSTLVNRLALDLANTEDENPISIAVLAVDPSSPFSGGALLGDRVRMRDLMEHPEIFIRSLATRGVLGGLARAANEMVLALEIAGFEIILVETVGAGQSEVDIARLAHSTLVVESPGLGDDVQAAKAGIMEIADIIVVNKADKSGADATARSLQAMLQINLELEPPRNSNQCWKVPVLKTSALNSEGIQFLKQTIHQHQDWLRASGEWQNRNQVRMKALFERLLHEKLYRKWHDNLPKFQKDQLLAAIQSQKISPYQAIRQILPD